MSTTPSTLPINPVVRYRLRTLLGLMTVAAILAAVAGAYYRLQTPETQARLLVFWTIVVASGAFAIWHHWKSAWRIPEKAGTPRFIIASPTPGNWHWWRPSWRRYLLPLVWLVLVTVDSHEIVESVARSQGLSLVFWKGIKNGMLLTAYTIGFVAIPAYLCELGVVAYNQGWAPWKYVRHASWLPDRPTTLKLRRLDGDLYLEIPAKDRAAIEAFLREKTVFKDAEAQSAEAESKTSLVAPSYDSRSVGF